MPTICLFADTNLFLHYKTLDQIDWSILGDFDSIEVVVCPPVQREIDDLKGGRQGRRSERARKTASMLMKIAEHGPQQQRAPSPRVILDLDVTSQPKQGLADWLDYSQSDDCIIGHLAQFREDNPSANAHLLTRDSGPVLKARNLGIPYIRIPDDWLMPPEPDDREREIQQLKRQLQEFQAQEPEFNFSCDQMSADQSGKVEIAYGAFQPLTSRERDQLLERLQERYPRRVANRKLISADVVSQYEDRDYPAWISECQEWMDVVHGVVQPEHCPELTVSIQNTGSRPARNTLIEIRASENIGLTVPMTELRELGLIPVLERPKPPRQPKPRRSLPYILNNRPGLIRMTPPDLDIPQYRRDQEDFEYASDVKLEIEPSVVLTCGLWRHSMEPQVFAVRLVPEKLDSPIKGEITCTVHADNLTTPAMFKLLVTLSPDYCSALEPALEWFTIPHPDERDV